MGLLSLLVAVVFIALFISHPFIAFFTCVALAVVGIILSDTYAKRTIYLKEKAKHEDKKCE